jgi:hypothetical protein
MKRLVIASALALAVAAMPATAAAASFTGSVDYTGVHTPDNGDLTLATNSTIDLNVVVISTGSFAAAGIGFPDTLVHQSPLFYNPAGTPYAPLWTHVASGISFDLTSLNIVTSTENQLGLTGVGVFKGAGFDDTPGKWNMTLNNLGEITGSFSSSSAVPEPATTALFGMAMFGAAAAARRRKRAQAKV